MPFGGKYRIIDFPLSNCVNSGIETVGVLTQYQPLELNDYIGKPITLTVTGTGVYYGSRQYTTDPVVSSRQVTEVSLNRSQPFVGDTLSAVLKPSSATVSYSWRVGGIEVSTEATYTVQQSDIGKLIQSRSTALTPSAAWPSARPPARCAAARKCSPSI